MTPPATITLEQLLRRYDTLLLDAYGVLVDRQGALPGAIALIERLNREQRRYFILTNSASLLPGAMAANFQRLGLAIGAQRIISSGMLLRRYYAEHQLTTAPTLVLGPEDARSYVREAGGVPLDAGAGLDAVQAIVIADQQGFAPLEGLDAALNLILRRLDRGEPLHLILCNPDLIYPVAPGEFGLTAGALAAMLEAVLAERYGEAAPRFTPLGKPHLPLFAEAARRGGGRMVMLGDQLATDILGAQRAGLDAVLVQTGIAGRHAGGSAIIPDFLLPSLST